jgi:hypothetical protein
MLILIIILFFTYKPTKPNFSIAKIEIKKLNLSRTILNSMIKIDLLSKNPNTNVRINYDEFHIYATYNNKNLTNESIVAPFKQGEGETDIMSSLLIGNGLIVEPSISYELSRAQTFGSLRLTIIANAKLKWHIADWMSGPRTIQVTCDCMVYFQDGSPVNDPHLSTLQGCKTYL